MSLVPDAYVLLAGEDESEEVGSATDGEGAFQFEGLTCGRYTIRVAKEGFEPSQIDVTVPSEEPLSIVLSLVDLYEDVTVYDAEDQINVGYPAQRRFSSARL